MSTDAFFSLLIGIPISIITGLYSGIIVSRYTRFAELRNEVLRIIRAIDFMQEQHGLRISNDNDLSRLPLIAGDFYYLQHRAAGDTVNALRAEIDEVSMHARAGRLDSSMYEKSFASWQQTARSLPPARAVLWSLWHPL
jgi:hypothetical protein